MTETNDSNVVALYNDEIDRKVLALRLNGVSIRRIGRELKLTDKQTLAALDRVLPSLGPDLRTRLFREDLARCDDLMVYWYQKAKDGSAVATSLCVDLMKRRAAMAGTDSPQRIDVVVAQQVADDPSSTVQLLAELDRIAAERTPPSDPVIEAKTDP